ncbi:hypothetical protein HanRHA438_Chr13g0624271 [Helianthus annuus]|nr:hypothetical protein HanRHA438_Chr13g0624271 [Helianthus annuus]
MVPTLWLPVSSIFLGPNIASLFSLTSLDCLFNLGASLSCSWPTRAHVTHVPTPRLKTRFVADPVRLPVLEHDRNHIWVHLSVSHVVRFSKGFFNFFSTSRFSNFFRDSLGSVSFASWGKDTDVTWHWESPVWLVTPVVYEAYRVLQLMRGLKLGAELGAPGWTLHVIRGLVCWWVLVLGEQVMRVAWYAGFTVTFVKKRHPTLVMFELLLVDAQCKFHVTILVLFVKYNNKV